MPLSFPGSPSVNDTYTVGQRTWTWDGSIWSLSADTIGSASVTSSELASSAVTTAKIAANAVTQAKLASNLSAVTVTTTANRDTDIPSPFTGQLAILTDTKKIQLYDGTSWVNVSLAPPETPTSLSATALSTTSVSIAFTAGGANGSPITNYKYALSTNGGSTYGSFTALSPEDILTPITISGLTAATAYYIKLKAVNDMGDSVASSAVSISTLATPDAPTSLSAGSITVSSADISFTPGAQGGSAISNYQYALSTNGGSTYGSFTALSPADATSPITITGLTNGIAYYAKLKAVNTDGAGTESSAVSFTTLTYPSAVDYLVVAGGGSGGRENFQSGSGGGGGAGGLRSSVTQTGGGGTLETALAVSTGIAYTITVGSGGAGIGGLYAGSTGNDGTTSVFSTITTVGGGGGGGGTVNPCAGRLGGSGGGATNQNAGSVGGAGTAIQGYAGGTAGTANVGGGGGGAGAVGGSGTSVGITGGAGGVGVAVAITGSSVYYGGGGGGCGNTAGAGGNGGGGAGADDSPSPYVSAVSGTANTGGGGGGGQNNSANTSGSGGSGIVVLRYADTFADLTTIGAGLTYTLTNTGGYKIYSFTAGTGSITI